MNEKQLCILDDNEDYAELLMDVATDAGWQAQTVSSAAAFFSTDLSSCRVLVLDLVMPDVDGIEVIQRLSATQTELSLILISGYDKAILQSAQLMARAGNINVITCLTKPMSIQDFTQVLDSIQL